jgi:very-short-patch-repair endonuclease
MYRDSDQREFARRLRKEMTPAERALWRVLRADQLRGYRFRRQAAIGDYVVDFGCFSHRVIVELDGPQHEEPLVMAYDAERSAWLAERGFVVLRFRNQVLDEGTRLVAEEILRVLELRKPQLNASPLPSPLRQGEGAGGNRSS